MPDVFHISTELNWSFALAIAWIAGELTHRWVGMPRISCYGIVGFLLGQSQSGFLPLEEVGSITLLANIAFGLMLFELGCRINLRWLRSNPWLGITGVVEAGGTFLAVYAFSQWYGLPRLTSLLLSALAMSTSPASVLRVVNEQSSSGQVTERTLHLSAFNCVLAVLAFKATLGLWVFQNTGNMLHALWNSLAVLIVSAGLGALFGVIIPWLLRRMGSLQHDATVAFAIAVIVLVAIVHSLQFSPVLATLTFGLVVRHRRVTLNQAQRSFGALGNLLTVLLFVYVASTLEWQRVAAGAWLAIVLVVIRFIAKIAFVSVFARLSGISWRKGVLTGIALTPISVFVILLLEQTRSVGIGLVDELAALAATTLLLEVIGPIFTHWALVLAHEVPEVRET